MKKFILVFLFFCLVLVAGYLQHDDPDMYVHLAMGNIISHQGIIHHEVLSQAGSNRSYLPIEWLFQILLYWFLNFFGFNAYKIFTAILTVLQVGTFFVLLRKVLRVNQLFSLLLTTSYLLLTYQFLVTRPQIFANLFLILTLIIILKYFFDNKNYLYLLLPIVYVWANLHPSVVLAVLLCVAYSLLCLFYIITKHQGFWLKKFQTLGIYSILVSAVTILPPQNFNVYQFLLRMYQYNYINSVINKEWMPLYNSIIPTIFYSFVVGVSVLFFLYLILYKKIFIKSMWILPLFVFIPYGYLAIRNIYFGYLSAMILLGWSMAQIYSKRVIQIITICMTFILLVEFWVTISNYQSSTFNWPSNAADFILQNSIQGNMLNQFGYGGYLEYRLYPQQKVWMDGRAEPFLCCEMPDYYNLQINAPKSLVNYKKIFNTFLDKYQFSFAAIVTKNDPSGTVLSNMFEKQSQWFLIYKDNVSEIWIKNDGKNTKLLDALKNNHSSQSTATTKIYSNSEMDLTFNYPNRFLLSQVTPHLIGLKNPSSTSTDSLLYIFETTVTSNTKSIDIPFVIKGKLQNEVPVSLRDFTAKQVTYSDGITFLTLRKNQQFIMVRIPKDSKDLEDAINEFVNSVKLLQ